MYGHKGRELNATFFSQTFRISRQNPGISRQKSLISLVSRGMPNFLAPTPSRGRPPPHRKISGLKSLGLCFFFVREILWISGRFWLPFTPKWFSGFARNRQGFFSVFSSLRELARLGFTGKLEVYRNTFLGSSVLTFFWLPFTPKFLQINAPPVFFGVLFFCNFYGNSLRHRFFFVTPMRSSGSRVDIAQKPNKSGQILDQHWKIFFVIFTKLVPRRIFFVLQKFWCWWCHSNRNVYQTNSPELEVGSGKNYPCPHNLFDFLGQSFRRETWHCSADIQGPLSVDLPELPIRNSEEFEVDNRRNYLTVPQKGGRKRG